MKILVICTECHNMIDIVLPEKYIKAKKITCIECKLSRLAKKYQQEVIEKPYIGFSNITT